ncbi:hypothetical protein [Plasmodium yoelii yoelii]|uniref:Uncharacterized protein n=1 Tax=Plasmodium yoelii yoelii TaxID=73239 RepID=Q7RKQ2_PLAYO|nr:hypothetical protein [Plasmodium yoelii yoelii]
MITYSEYFDEYTADLNKYLHKIKHSIYNIKNKEDYNKIREYITESEKCINKYNSDLKKYKNILEKMNGDYYSEVTDREYDLTKKYIEGTNFLDESERRAQDVEDMGRRNKTGAKQNKENYVELICFFYFYIFFNYKASSLICYKLTRRIST